MSTYRSIQSALNRAAEVQIQKHYRQESAFKKAFSQSDVTKQKPQEIKQEPSEVKQEATLARRPLVTQMAF